MRNALDRLYKTKLQLIAVVMTFTGVVCLVLTQWVKSSHQMTWLQQLPLTDFGSALLTTGMLAVIFEYLDRKDGDERATQRLRQVLHDEAPAIRDAVLDGFAFNPEALKDVASPELLDRIATNALAIRLKDQALAEEAYTDLRNQLIDGGERWHDVHVTITLAPWKQGPASGRGAMFVATVRREYRVRPRSTVLRFACVSDLTEYHELRHDPSMAAVCHFPTVGDVQADSPGVFELVQFTIDGEERRIRRVGRKGTKLYTVALDPGHSTDQSVMISYTYRLLIQQAGHLFYLDAHRPSKGLHVQLSYGDTGIRYVNALDFIASAEQPHILRSPASVPTPSINVGFDGWVLPRSGVAFVWVLDAEL